VIGYWLLVIGDCFAHYSFSEDAVFGD